MSFSSCAEAGCRFPVLMSEQGARSSLAVPRVTKAVVVDDTGVNLSDMFKKALENPVSKGGAALAPAAAESPAAGTCAPGGRVVRRKPAYITTFKAAAFRLHSFVM